MYGLAFYLRDARGSLLGAVEVTRHLRRCCVWRGLMKPDATTHSGSGGGAGPIPNRCVRTPPSSSDVPSGMSGTDNNSRTSGQRQQGQQRRQGVERAAFGIIDRGFTPDHDERPFSESMPHTHTQQGVRKIFSSWSITRETRDGHTETGRTRQSPVQRAFKTSVHGSA